MLKEYDYLNDYTVGEKFISPARTLTEADLVNFAGITGDWHPLHTDAEYAAKTPFGSRIIHGMLVMCIGMILPFRWGQNSSFLPKSFIAFYGMDEVRFTAPARIGDTIHCEAEIAAITDKDKDKGTLSVRHLIKNQRNDILITYVVKLLCAKRPV